MTIRPWPALRSGWEALRASLWLVPALLVAGATLLALGLTALDQRIGSAPLARWPLLFGAGADGSRALLSAIAGSMVTVAGVVFSITIVALTLASSQYTSRILRNFMADRATQTVLGVFVGVFVYCLIVLRTIRGGDEGTFVPALSVLAGLLLAFVAIGVLIFFIHHIAASIQASSIVESAAHETLAAVARWYPPRDGTPEPAPPGRPAGLQWRPVPAQRSGYVQAVDADALLAAAREHGVVVCMERAVGEFVVEGSALASAAGARVGDALDALAAAFTLARERNVHQDPAYGIRQIVDIALKALSPGINDTTTAINCIDYLSAILVSLAGRRIAPPCRHDRGQPCVLARGPDFETLLHESFEQIRRHADGNVAVYARLLEALTSVAERSDDARQRQALREQGRRVAASAERSVPDVHDLAALRERHAMLERDDRQP